MIPNYDNGRTKISSLIPLMAIVILVQYHYKFLKMAGNILEHCKTEALYSKSRARTQDKVARMHRLYEFKVTRLARENGPEGTRTPDLKLRKLAHYPSCATGPKKLQVVPL
jgi:hypothetical protein